MGDRGIAHWNVSYREPASGGRVELDGILLIDFDPEGQCTGHREWYDRHEYPA